MIEIAKSCLENLARKNIFATDGTRRAATMLRDRVVAAFLGDLAAGFAEQAGELNRLVDDDSADRRTSGNRSHVWRDVELAFGSGDVAILTKVVRAIEELEEAYVFAGVEYCLADFREPLVRHEQFVDNTRRRLASLRDTLAARGRNCPQHAAL
jgi:hypothetical protein